MTFSPLSYNNTVKIRGIVESQITIDNTYATFIFILLCKNVVHHIELKAVRDFFFSHNQQA